PLSTGKVPGSARSNTLACVLGSAPNVVEEPENSLDLVASCTCTSSPMTVSHAMVISPVPVLLLAWARAGGAGVPIRRLLEAMCQIQQLPFGEVATDDLQAYRQTADDTGGYRQARKACQVHRDGVDVFEIHGHRVLGFGANGK